MGLFVWISVVILIIIGNYETSCQRVVFAAIGDWGDDPAGAKSMGYDDQVALAQVMNDWCAANSCNYVVSTGDNFYPDGVTSVDDPRWNISWYDVYDGDALKALPWIISVGNHDHYRLGPDPNRVNYQLEFATIEPRWHFPELYYEYRLEQAGMKIHMLILDTQSLIDGLEVDRDVQMQFVNDTLENSLAFAPDWRMIIGHHPLKSCGRYAPGSFLNILDLDTIFDYYNTDLYIDGHDHNLQRIVRYTGEGMDYVVTGGGGRGNYEKSVRCREMLDNGFELPFFAASYGFVGLIVEQTQVTAQYIGINGTLLYEFTRQH